MKQQFSGIASRGNALTEYGLPLAGLLLVAAVISTVLNINQVMGAYFASASGNTQQEIQQRTFRPKAMATGVEGTTGNGSSELPTPAGLTDGQGRQLEVPAPGDRLSGYLKDGEDIGAYDGPLSRQKRVNTTGANGDRLFSFDRGGGPAQSGIGLGTGSKPPPIVTDPPSDQACEDAPNGEAVSCAYEPEVILKPEP